MSAVRQAPPAGQLDAREIAASLVVKLPVDGSKRRLQADIDASVGKGWTLRRLFPPDRAHPDLQAWFVASGPAPVTAGLSEIPATWEAAHRLQATGPYEIEPQVPKSAYAPMRIGAGLGPETHLPASERRRWAQVVSRVDRAHRLAPLPGGRSRGAGVVIGHPDTGFTRHPGIYPAALDLEMDHDILAPDDDAEDPMLSGNVGHGTHTGYVIAGRPFAGMLGVAPEATVRPIRTITSVVALFGGNVARAIDYARRTGCDVISMSLGGLFLGGVRDAVNAAVADGCIVMAAAGNIWPWVVEPANYPACIAVAAVNADLRPWSGSAKGPQVVISAPGESVWTATWRQGRRASFRSSGTSYAVAHLAGVAALWLAHHGPPTIRQRFGGQTSSVFQQLLADTAQRPRGWPHSGMGTGIVDAHALLSAPLPTAAGLAVGAAPATDGPTPARELLRGLAPDPVFDALTTPIDAGAAAAVDGSRQADLLYQELVYVTTEQPAVEASLQVAADLDRRVLPTLVASQASPTLARRLGGHQDRAEAVIPIK